MSYSGMFRIALALVLSASAARAGSITGTVLFEGEPPTQPKLKRDVDPKCSKDRLDEAIVVTKGKLRDVVVRIKNGTTGKHEVPAVAVVIDQKDCMYTPRVVGLVAGQKLVVRNSDNTFHNVHGVLMGKDVFNKPQAPKAADLTLDVAQAKPDDVIGLQCDVHAWMKAYAAVNDSPFFAVTGDDGKFKIENLPVGDYTLEAWHPTLGTKTMKVSIGKAKRGDVTARFSYKANEM
jgi:plastocyanin